MRFRNSFMILASLLVVALYVITDPAAGLITKLPFGATTVVLITIALKAVWYITLLHIGRRALLDYIDLSQLFTIAQQSPEGAGKAIIGIGLFEVAIALCVIAAVLG